ncbi:MAG: hypothetical protein LUQ38_00905 [Methanotrichaceae archaeon]|nr:hypothetical protein [Methanotrichaceae archaeon]
MVVPDYQSFMLPLLKFAEDGKEHGQSEAAEALARYFNATEMGYQGLSRNLSQKLLDHVK